MLSDTLFNSVKIDEADARDWLTSQPSDSIDLILTSPPYAMQRKDSYGGTPADDYARWMLPITDEMIRVLKPAGSFVLNIKEHVEAGQRHPYVYELVIKMTRRGMALD